MIIQYLQYKLSKNKTCSKIVCTMKVHNICRSTNHTNTYAQRCMLQTNNHYNYWVVKRPAKWSYPFLWGRFSSISRKLSLRSLIFCSSSSFCWDCSSVNSPPTLWSTENILTFNSVCEHKHPPPPPHTHTHMHTHKHIQKAHKDPHTKPHTHIRVAEGLRASRVCALSLENTGIDSGIRLKTVTFSRKDPRDNHAKREECSTTCSPVLREVMFHPWSLTVLLTHVC